MKQTVSLNGTWSLYYYDADKIFVSGPLDLKQQGIGCIPATVPGNVEVSLAEAGVIPKELYKGMATKNNQQWEAYDWWYETVFQAETRQNRRLYLRFGAVDCFAEYYLNGTLVYQSENAFMEHMFEITEYLEETNTLQIHIKSAAKYAFTKEYSQAELHDALAAPAHIRKSAHSFGWDIFPRAVTAGIWKDVDLVLSDNINLEDVNYIVTEADSQRAQIQFRVNVAAPYEIFKRDVRIRISGNCGGQGFAKTYSMHGFKAGMFQMAVDNPKLWWPSGYGEANIYDTLVELLVDEKVCDSCTVPVGIRTVALKRTETLLDQGHCFQFVINGVDIMCRGSNWVPLDAYSSRHRERYSRALELVDDCNCNILRVWGGGVYEQPEFYAYCDRHGIMVWQDFMMACIPPATDEILLKNMEQEFTWAVKTLRNHPSIVLWAGDNEVDEMNAIYHMRLGKNKITRQLIPEILGRHDNSRPYLPSSPYIPDELFESYPADVFVERHLWGARDYYKADFYKLSKAHFVSEVGYHGCPSPDSVRRIVDEDCVYPIFNEQWSLHSSDQRGQMHRVNLMMDQVNQLFGFCPATIDDFSLASQISQGEAMKFFVERVRIRKPYTSGVIWWNLLDGWPQMSDAVVDYFFQKKLAYTYLKRSQEPFVVMIDEMRDWCYCPVASNDTLDSICFDLKIYDIDSNQILYQNSATIAPNSNLRLDGIRMHYHEQRFLVLEWLVNEKRFYNHYLCGMPAFDFAQYQIWLEKYQKITNGRAV